MSIITTKNGLEKIDLREGWDKVRFRLLRASYVVEVIVTAFRKKYGIVIRNGKSNWEDVAFTKYWGKLVPYLEKFKFFDYKDVDQDSKINRGFALIFGLRLLEEELFPEIALLSDKLSMSEGYLRVFMLYGTRTTKVDGPVTLERMMVGDKVRKTGVYLRMNDIQNIEELKEVYRNYRKSYMDGRYVTILEKNLPMHMKPRKKIVSKEDYWKVKVYLRTQDELSSLPAKKLSLAFENIAGSLLDEIDFVSDEIEEKTYRKANQIYRSAYNDVVERYKLPTLRELPTLLRVIGC